MYALVKISYISSYHPSLKTPTMIYDCRGSWKKRKVFPELSFNEWQRNRGTLYHYLVYLTINTYVSKMFLHRHTYFVKYWNIHCCPGSLEVVHRTLIPLRFSVYINLDLSIKRKAQNYIIVYFLSLKQYIKHLLCQW